MTLQDKLNAMNTNKTTISLSSRTYSGLGGIGWSCYLEYENTNREAFRITSEDYLTVDEAVVEVYEKFMSITGKAFEEARPPQLTYSQGQEHFDA